MTPAQSRLIRVDDEEHELCQVCGFEVDSECVCLDNPSAVLVNEWEPGERFES